MNYNIVYEKGHAVEYNKDHDRGYYYGYHKGFKKGYDFGYDDGWIRKDKKLILEPSYPEYLVYEGRDKYYVY